MSTLQGGRAGGIPENAKINFLRIFSKSFSSDVLKLVGHFNMSFDVCFMLGCGKHEKYENETLQTFKTHDNEVSGRIETELR